MIGEELPLMPLYTCLLYTSEVVAGNLRYAVAQHQVLLHGRTAQIEVAVLQTLSLIHILMDWLAAQ